MKLGVVKENALALIIALVLAFIVMFFVSRTDFLKADILWVEEEDQVMLWDVVAYFEWDKLLIESNKNIEWLSSMSFDIVYDSSEITIKEDIVSSNYSYSTSSWDWFVKFIVTWLWSIEQWDEVLQIDMDERPDLNISDLTVSFTDWTTESLSITSTN